MEAVVGSAAGLARGEMAAERVAARSVSSWRGVVLAATLALGLFLLAWLPRIAVIDAYLTTDEGNWMGRTGLFVKGSLQGDPLLTRQSGHPGVTTMWTALTGIGLDNALYLADYVRPDGLEKAPGYLDLLRQARRPFTVLTSLAVVVISLLVWRLLGGGPALIVGVLLALEPFFLAHSGVVHRDGMLSSYITIAYLSALVYWGRGAGRGYLVLCGLATGLAFLTKTPSALLALFIPALALVASWLRGKLRSAADLRRLVLEGAIWGVLAGGLALLAWPSLRADFLGTLEYMKDYTEVVGGGEHENFFRGQPVGDPGPLYYVVAFGFRVSPVTLLGLVLLMLNLLPIGSRRLPRHWYALLAAVGAFIALFTAMMMYPPKKFDRYLLPTFPSWEILAAVGFWLTFDRVGALIREIRARRRSAEGTPTLPRSHAPTLAVFVVVLGLAQMWPALQAFPYYLSYYNPIFGGGKAAAKNLVVGWGEGLDQVTAHLNAKPDAERLTLAGFYPRVLMAQFKGNVLPDKQYDPAEADYVVLYINAVQRDLANSLRTAVRGRKAERVFTINGIEYARLYQVRPPLNRSAVGTEFGPLRLDRTYLRSEERRFLKSENIHAGDTLLLTLRWTLLQPVDSDYVATVALLDRRGGVVAETADRVGAPDESTSVIRPGHFLTEVHRLDLPPQMNGEYQLAVSVRPRPDGARVPISTWPEKLSAELRRSESVVVETVQITPPEAD